MGFYDIKFGTSDAETELIRTPEIFDYAFFDPHNYLQELIDGNKFILLGRKGDGKSSYLAKMQRLSKQDVSLETIPVSLERLNSKFFEKFTDTDLSGGKRYVPMWKCIILLELIKHLEKRNFQIQRDNYIALVAALDKMGLLHGDTLETTITKLDATDFTICVDNWITYGRHREKEVVFRGANDICYTLEKEISSVYMGDSKFRMVFDAIDDILRNAKINTEIITGLIRAANEINNNFDKKALKFKALVLIRTDIFNICRDPDISKIRLASCIDLSWKVDLNRAYEADLTRLIMMRFAMSDMKFADYCTLWDTYFPIEIDGKDSLLYMLENTLYKPRDILMFFEAARHMIGPMERKLSECEFREILKTYSEDYFINFMQDELTGFLADDAINKLHSVFSKIGSRRFPVSDFETEIRRREEFKGITAETILEMLFDRGYIGQFRKRPERMKDEFYFQTHINPKEKFDKDDDCQIHRGLVRAVGL